MVLLNTIVIIHDIPLINNPVIIEPRQIFFSLPSPPALKKRPVLFLGEKIF